MIMKAVAFALLVLSVSAQNCPTFPGGQVPFSTVTATSEMLSRTLGEGQGLTLLAMEQPNPAMPLFKQVFSALSSGRPFYFGAVTGILEGTMHVLKSVSSTELSEVLSFIGLPVQSSLPPICLNGPPAFPRLGASFATSSLGPNSLTQVQTIHTSASQSAPQLSMARLALQADAVPRPAPQVLSASLVPPSSGLLDQGSANQSFSTVTIRAQSSPLLGSSLQSAPDTQQLIASALSALSPGEQMDLKNRLNIGSIEELTSLFNPPQPAKPPVYRYVRKNQFNIGGILSGTGADKVMNPVREIVH